MKKTSAAEFTRSSTKVQNRPGRDHLQTTEVRPRANRHPPAVWDAAACPLAACTPFHCPSAQPRPHLMLSTLPRLPDSVPCAHLRPAIHGDPSVTPALPSRIRLPIHCCGVAAGRPPWPTWCVSRSPVVCAGCSFRPSSFGCGTRPTSTTSSSRWRSVVAGRRGTPTSTTARGKRPLLSWHKNPADNSSSNPGRSSGPLGGGP